MFLQAIGNYFPTIDDKMKSKMDENPNPQNYLIRRIISGPRKPTDESLFFKFPTSNNFHLKSKSTDLIKGLVTRL